MTRHAGFAPPGPIQQKWASRKDDYKLIAPNNRRKYTVLVVGTGLAGASLAAKLAKVTVGTHASIRCSLVNGQNTLAAFSGKGD